MKSTFTLIVIFCLFGLGCQEKDNTPEYLWDEARMVEVMTEVQIAEALVRLGYHRSTDSMHLNDSVFNAALRTVNTNRADFDSNFNYYQGQPDKMEKVFEQVINNLSARSAEIKAAQLKAQEKGVQDLTD
tara:strand:- start:551 stop:940 length:390 start_codon:yes stop_codon:yes gene_type:complete